MEITEVRIKLTEASEDRLRAFCSITFDHCFVVRDLKIIEGNSGPFVAMPSRKLTAHCQACGVKNHLRARFCNQCGRRLSTNLDFDAQGRAKLYADIAHPINAHCREIIQKRVIEEFHAELERAKQPGYASRYDDDYGESGDDDDRWRTDTSRPVEPTKAGPQPSDPQRRTEPAEPGLSGPHQPPAEQPDETGAKENRERGDFGKGVFE